MKKILIGILSIVLILSVAGCAKSSDSTAGNSDTDSKENLATDTESEDITLVLDWTPNTNHTGFYVAQAKGYFAAEGLNVTIVQPPENGAETLVSGGSAQFGVSFQDSLSEALIGDSALPVTAVAALIQHNTSGIISRVGEGMDTPKGLEDKKYATWDMDIEKAILRTVVEVDGGNFDDVILIPSTVTDEVTALETKSVDAIWIFYAWAGIKAEISSLETDYFAFRDIDDVFDYYTPILIANNEFLSEQPEVAKAFLRAVAKGYEDAISDPEGAADILLEAVPELDSDLVYASQEYLKDQYKAEVDQWGYIDPARWNAFYNWLNENELLAESIPENTGFTNDYLSE